MKVVNLARKLAQFDEQWQPKIVGESNGQLIKLAKLQGEFVWHRHEHDDELFFVVKGTLRICLRDREVSLQPGEFFVVPKNVEHLPIADEECHVMLIEPASVLNTGNLRNQRTVEQLERI